MSLYIVQDTQEVDVFSEKGELLKVEAVTISKSNLVIIYKS